MSINIMIKLYGKVIKEKTVPAITKLKMHGKHTILFFAAACATFVLCGQDQKLKLWYQTPAQKWTDALPIGNGRLGAMIYGGVEEEHLQLNEETLWTGGPRAYQRQDAYKYLQPIRQLLFDGKQKEAEALAEQHFMGIKSHEAEYDALKAAWLQKQRSDTVPPLNAHWKQMAIPTPNGWEEAGLEGLDGAVWFKNSFQLPPAWAGKDMVLELGRIRDLDFTYVNGKRVGTAEGITAKRVYTVPASLLKQGRNEILIQVINYYDKGGLIGVKGTDPTFLLYPEGDKLVTPKRALLLSTNWQYRIQDSTPPLFPQYEASYQPFGDLWMRFNHPKAGIINYRRELELTSAISRVSYTCNGVAYTREYLASAPDQAVAIRLTASKRASIGLQAFFSTAHKLSSTRKIDDHTLALSLQVRDGVLKGAGLLQVQAQGGRVQVTADKISVTGADTVTFYLTTATSFKNYQDVSGDPEAICLDRMQNLRNKNFGAVQTAHVEDYRRYFDAFSIYLGKSAHDILPTDQRILQYTHATDPALLALYVQYARYLLIASSRPGTQAANLQGIWNNLLTPPWGSKYTTNINLQMNYWPAELLNLSALTEPLFHLIGDAAEAGKLSAAAHYNAPGWVLHHNTDLWRGTAPINAANHGIWVTGAAWLCEHLWEHYLFTQDKTFLQQAYPLMKGSADFFTSFLIPDPRTGRLISTPSNSPEHGGLVAGPTMDHQIIRELLKNCISASRLLQTDSLLREKWKETAGRIAPNRVGKLGELQEWLEQKEDTTEKHRHVSHLWGVYPGADITWDSTRLMQAARQSLLYRGDEGTGWSIAWKVNLWARFKDGDHALLMMDKLLTPAEGAAGSERGGVYRNMFDAHPPFQIDGNFGGAAGLAEMLLQSHMPWIELLPALPSGLPEGEVKGLCARGGFVFNLRWSKGMLDGVEILSKAGGDCRLRYKDRMITFKTTSGTWYKLTGELKEK